MSRRHVRPFSLLACMLLVAAVACNDSPTEPNLDAALDELTTVALANGPFSDVLPLGPIVTGGDASANALIIFPGATIAGVDLADTERGLDVAEVRLLPAGGGGEVKLHFARGTGRLAEMEGEVAPFTYLVEPTDFASLAQAIAAATGSSGKVGTVTDWKLQYEDGARWQYRVSVTAADGDWRVRINATTSSVNRIQAR